MRTAAAQPAARPPPPARRRAITAAGCTNVPRAAPRATGARYMYASLSADKSLGYRVFVEPWMLVVYLSLFLPPAFPVFIITLASWLVYFVCVLPVQARCSAPPPVFAAAPPA